MSNSLVVCPNCGKKNRIPPAAKGVPRCGACHQSLPWIVDATEASFDSEIQTPMPVLVDFWAPWCGPCRMVSPLVERLAGDHAGHLKVVKLNVDEAPSVAARFGVQGIPMLTVMKNGGEADRAVGAVPEAQLRRWIAPHLKAGA